MRRFAGFLRAFRRDLLDAGQPLEDRHDGIRQVVDLAGFEFGDWVHRGKAAGKHEISGGKVRRKRRFSGRAGPFGGLSDPTVAKDVYLPNRKPK
jgi:hypothetical protein